jgi:hypothetical protein
MVGVGGIAAPYWADRVHSQNYAPLPRDRGFWAVTHEDGALWLIYSDDHAHWLGRNVWQRDDGEPGEWEAEDIYGWTDDQDDAEEANMLLGAA